MPTTPHHPSAPSPVGCGSFEPGTDPAATLRSAVDAAQVAWAAEQELCLNYLRAEAHVTGALNMRGALLAHLGPAARSAAAVQLGSLYDSRDRAKAAYEQARDRRMLAFYEQAEASAALTQFAVVGEAYTLQAA